MYLEPQLTASVHNILNQNCQLGKTAIPSKVVFNILLVVYTAGVCDDVSARPVHPSTFIIVVYIYFKPNGMR